MTTTSGQNPHIEAYVLREEDKVIRTSMRSSHGSWFIGTLLEGDVFYHYPSEKVTREYGYAWVYSPKKYGVYGGFGWVNITKIRRQKGNPSLPHFNSDVVHRLHHPKPTDSLRSRDFVHRHTDHPYPPKKSDDATGDVIIKPGVYVRFYANQKGGIPKDQHKQRGFLTSTDDVRARYIVLHTHKKLIAVDYYRHGFHGHKTPKKGDGIWGFILQEGDSQENYNFTYEIIKTPKKKKED